MEHARVALRRGPRSVALAVALIGWVPSGAVGQWSGRVDTDVRGYPDPAADPDADDWEIGFSVGVDGVFSWGDGHYLTVAPRVRLDPSRSERSRLDLAELSWERIMTRWEIVVGFRTVSWRVAESVSLVDVVNQIDLGDDGATPELLGQPLFGARWLSSAGAFEAYLLPLFRERRFAGHGGALWSTRPVAADRARFEHAWGRHHLDWVARWSHILGDLDVALTHFAGTDRQPRMTATALPGGGPGVLIPVYDLMNQTTLAAQWTRNRWIGKLEVLRRATRDGDFVALVGGVEFAFADYLSVFAEYLRDSRGSEATTSMENDVFAGARLLTQDWTLSTRVLVDHRSANVAWSTAASRRLGDSATAELDGRLFEGDPSDEPAHAHRLDTRLALKLSYFF